MANSTTQLNLLSASQASKEITANALFDVASPAMVLGRNANTTSGLVWGYYGGTVRYGSALNQIANGTVNLTANTTNYVEFNQTSGAIAVNTTGWTATDMSRMYKIVTGASAVTSYEDWRDFSAIASGGGGTSLSSYKETSGMSGGSIVSATNTLIAGTGNTVYGGNFSVAIGINNTLSTGYSFRTIIGHGNRAGGDYSHAFGFSNNLGSSYMKMAIGYYHESSGASTTGLATLMGSYGFATRHGSWNYSVPFWKTSLSGIHGHSRVMPSNMTASSETVYLESPKDNNNNNDQGVIIRNNTSNVIRGYVIAKSNSSKNTTSVWKVEAVVRCNASGTVTIVGTPTVAVVAQDSALSSSNLVFSVTTNKFNLECTGVASTVMPWTSDLEITEIFFDQ